MPNIKCLQCDAYISDPCVKMSGLFLIKMDLEAQPLPDDTKIDNINTLIQEDLGLINHDQVFQSFKINRRTALPPSPTLFTLRCINGHTNQYLITCP